MSFITDIFIKPRKPALVQLPSGSFTIDPKGEVITSTLPRSFEAAHLKTISGLVLAAFRSAERAEIRLVEITVLYSALKLVARDQRGGAIIYLMPQTLTRA